MKRWFAFVISAVVLVICASCGDGDGKADDPTATVTPPTRAGSFSGYDDDVDIRGDSLHTLDNVAPPRELVPEDAALAEEDEAGLRPDPAMTTQQAGQIDKIGVEIEAAWQLLRSADAPGERHGLRERILRTHIKLVRHLAELDQGAECWAEFRKLRNVPNRLVAGGENWPQLPERHASQQRLADGLRIDHVAQQCGKTFIGHKRAAWAIRFATESNRARAAANE